MDAKWEEVKKALLETKREGVEDLILYLEDIGFTNAPCSGGNHLCKEGGLLEHSLNVYHTAINTAKSLYGKLTKDQKTSIAIAALLHDVGKCGDFGEALYVPNILKSGEQSKAKPYERNKNIPLYAEHAVLSLIHIWKWIDLTPEEEHAIRYHDGLYERYNSNYAGSETWLSMIIHFSDMWCSRIIEIESKEEK